MSDTTTEDLGAFDERPVFHTAIKVTKAGDGLSAALEVDPELLHLGERRFVVLETIVSKVEFVPIRGAPGVVRVHTLEARAGTMVDASLVEAELLDQQLRIEHAREAQAERDRERDRLAKEAERAAAGEVTLDVALDEQTDQADAPVDDDGADAL